MNQNLYRKITEGWDDEERIKFPLERLHYLPETTSTNDILIEGLKRGEARHLDLVFTDFQTAGRGRRGDRWEGIKGKNLLFSLAVRLGDDRTTWTQIPHLAAFHIGHAIESTLPTVEKIQAKWPNDLYLRDRKLAGILIETVLLPEPHAVIGVGINVNATLDDLPPELRIIATTLYEVHGCESSRLYLLGLIIRRFLEADPNTPTSFDEILTWLRQRDYLTGKDLEVTLTDTRLRGIGQGLGSGGELLLETADQKFHTILSAEKITVGS